MHVSLWRVLDEHRGRRVGLGASDEDRIGGQQPARRQGARLQPTSPHLRQRARDLPRSELHRLTTSLRNRPLR